MTSRLLTGLALILATLVLIALVTGGSFQDRNGQNVSIASISLLCGYLLLVSGGMYGAFKTNAGQMFKYAAVWIVIAGVIGLFYQVTH